MRSLLPWQRSSSSIRSSTVVCSEMSRLLYCDCTRSNREKRFFVSKDTDTESWRRKTTDVGHEDGVVDADQSAAAQLDGEARSAARITRLQFGRTRFVVEDQQRPHGSACGARKNKRIRHFHWLSPWEMTSLVRFSPLYPWGLARSIRNDVIFSPFFLSRAPTLWIGSLHKK